MSRIYLSRRDTRTPEQAAQTAAAAISEWREVEVRNALGQHFRSSMRVSIRRPWWMPAPLYRALMRSVVLETQSERTR